MQLNLQSISEPGLPGPKWQAIFQQYWPSYFAWLQSKGAAYEPDINKAQAALVTYMPEMLPTYERLCSLVEADYYAACFLTGFQPPAYISACSQAATTHGTIQLVRNYDYHPDLIEGNLLFTSWNGKKVIANSDCLVGALDGMNEDGLAISFTFGGRKQVGVGFGIPFILRYVLEFCSDVKQAVEAIISIPSHVSYNVTVVDRSGSIKTIQLSPDNPPSVSDIPYSTNHQGVIDWPENAQFNNTVGRAEFLEKNLEASKTNPYKIVDSFLEKPLYATRFSQGFGTLYTAIYRPEEGTVQLRWPQENLLQTFDNFKEQDTLIDFRRLPFDLVSGHKAGFSRPGPLYDGLTAANHHKVDDEHPLLHHQQELEKSIAAEDKLKKLRKNILPPGWTSWKKFADFWAGRGKK